MSPSEAKDYIKKRIDEEGILDVRDRLWLQPGGKQADWTFDLKALLLDRDFLNAVTIVFWDTYDPKQPIQICGLESASIPLITALVLANPLATGLYVRKSPKKKYDLRQLEGTLSGAPVVIVDDAINHSTSLEKQLNVLKDKARVAGYFSCVRLQNEDYYEYIRRGYGISTKFLFGAETFDLPVKKKSDRQVSFDTVWQKQHPSSHLFKVAIRRQAIKDRESIFINADDGIIYAHHADSGEVLWHKRVQKTVPYQYNQPGLCVVDQEICVPTEDGRVNFLNKSNGDIVWRRSIADHFYGMPLYVPNTKTIWITGRSGGYHVLFILSAKTGKTLQQWKFLSYLSGIDQVPNQVLVSLGNGEIKAFTPSGSRISWEITLEDNLHDGLSLSFDRRKCYSITELGHLYEIDLTSGSTKLVHDFGEDVFFCARPCVHGSLLILTSLHREVVCFDLINSIEKWSIVTKSRVFAGAVMSEDIVYVGNNESVLFAADVFTGEKLGQVTLPARMVAEPLEIDNQSIWLTTIDNTVTKISYQIN